MARRVAVRAVFGLWLAAATAFAAFAGITVPADAVIDSGLRKTVFVDRGKGFFEPRAVEAGRSFGDRMEIVKGLAVGEHVVVSGTFLVDSESRLKLAAEQVSNPAAGGSVAFQSAQSYSERAAPQ